MKRKGQRDNQRSHIYKFKNLLLPAATATLFMGDECLAEAVGGAIFLTFGIFVDPNFSRSSSSARDLRAVAVAPVSFKTIHKM